MHNIQLTILPMFKGAVLWHCCATTTFTGLTFSLDYKLPEARKPTPALSGVAAACAVSVPGEAAGGWLPSAASGCCGPRCAPRPPEVGNLPRGR